MSKMSKMSKKSRKNCGIITFAWLFFQFFISAFLSILYFNFTLLSVIATDIHQCVTQAVHWWLCKRDINIAIANTISNWLETIHLDGFAETNVKCEWNVKPRHSASFMFTNLICTKQASSDTFTSHVLCRWPVVWVVLHSFNFWCAVFPHISCEFYILFGAPHKMEATKQKVSIWSKHF